MSTKNMRPIVTTSTQRTLSKCTLCSSHLLPKHVEELSEQGWVLLSVQPPYYLNSNSKENDFMLFWTKVTWESI